MNTACEPFVADLVDAAEGRRPSPELEAHLAGCATCRAELKTLRADLALLAPEPAPEPGPWLAARIRAEASKGRHRRAFALLALAPAATMVLTVVLVLHVAPGPWHRRVPTTPRAAVATPLVLPDPGPEDPIGPGSILQDATQLDPQSVSALEAAVVDPDGVTPDDLDSVLGGGTWGVDVHDLMAGANPTDLASAFDDFPG